MKKSTTKWNVTQAVSTILKIGICSTAVYAGLLAMSFSPVVSIMLLSVGLIGAVCL